MAVRKTGKLGRKSRSRRRRARSELPIVDAMHQIWLAGMGALSRVQKEGPRAFEMLIVDGAGVLGQGRATAEKMLRDAIEAVQTTVGERMKTSRDQAAETWDNLEKIFQGRVQRVLHQAGVPTATEIRALAKRVDHLNASVEQLARARRPASRKSASRRRTAKRSAPRPAAA
jgi:poly(hydroxyalkanoate) granule-associated protein